MITILHGDNTEASRAEFLNIISVSHDKGKELRRIDGSAANVTSLTQGLESSSLFGNPLVVAIENLFSKLGKKESLAKQYSALLASSSDSCEVVLWEEKLLSDAAVRNLGQHVSVKVFKTPVIIFQFLDGLRPNGSKALLGTCEDLLASQAPELVFVMLVRRVRQLLMIAAGATPEGLQGWQVSRLTSQARSFTMEKLQTMYTKLLEMEYSTKTGASPFTLSERIKQFIIEL